MGQSLVPLLLRPPCRRPRGSSHPSGGERLRVVGAGVPDFRTFGRLDFYGIKGRAAVSELVASARSRSELAEAEALDLAVAETRAERQR